MTISYHGGNIIRGTAADRTGGTWTNLQSGYLFVESDTQLIYYWNGTAWSWAGGAAFDTPRNIIYIGDDGLYKFKNTQTGVITSSSSVNTTFSNAFSSGQNGYVEVREGTYPITGVISSLRLQQHVFLSKGAIIQVPNGYTGTVFSFNNSGGARNSILEGGQINEAGTPSRLWTAVELNSTTAAGVTFNHVKNMDITDAGTGILMKCDGTAAFVNGNTISNTNIYGSKICVDFQLANSGTKINANLFQDIRGQSTSSVDYGFKNVTGKYNTFHHCYVYDMSLDGTSISMNIASGAQSTLIVGGFVDHQNYADLGVGTIRMTGDIGINGLQVPTITNSTLASSTIKAEDNILRGIMTSQAFRKFGGFSGTSTTSNSGTGMWQGLIATNISGTGAVSNLQRSSSGVRVRYTTGATTGGIGGQRANSVVTTERSLDPVIIFKFAPQQTTNMRLGMGCTSSTAVSLGGADPLANLSGVMFFYDSGVSATNIAICQNDGSATSDATTISNIGAISTGVRYFGIRADNTNSKFQYYYGTTYPVAASTWTDISTKIPATTTGLGWAWYAENLASATDTWEMYGIHTEQNG